MPDNVPAGRGETLDRMRRLTHRRREVSPGAADANQGRRTARQAGDHLVRNVATARADETAKAVRGQLVGRSFDCLENVHALDAAGRLVGLLPLTRLMAASGYERLTELMSTDPLIVHPDLGQEQLLILAGRHGISAPAFVDAEVG